MEITTSRRAEADFKIARRCFDSANFRIQTVDIVARRLQNTFAIVHFTAVPAADGLDRNVGVQVQNVLPLGRNAAVIGGQAGEVQRRGEIHGLAAQTRLMLGDVLLQGSRHEGRAVYIQVVADSTAHLGPAVAQRPRHRHVHLEGRDGHGTGRHELELCAQGFISCVVG